MIRSRSRHGMSAVLVPALFAAFIVSGCSNVFSPLSSPSGDDQILSAARAALDQGDYQKAISLYGQVSSSNSDTAQSEIAYAELDQAGASMQQYAGAFGKGTSNIGPAITTFAESLMPGSQSKRIAIWTAFNNQTNIKSVKLNALVRFLGSLSLCAEILAEAGSNGTLTAADLNNGTVVISSTSVPAPLGGSLPGAGSYVAPATLANISGSPTYNIFNSALAEVIQDVDALGDAGTFGTSTLSFAQTLTNEFATLALVPGSTAAYAAALASIGIGTQ